LRKGIVDDDTYKDSGFFSYYYCDAFEDSNGDLLAEPKTVSADGENYVYVYYRRNYYTVQFHMGSYDSSNTSDPYRIAQTTESHVGYFTNSNDANSPSQNSSYWTEATGFYYPRSEAPTIQFYTDDENYTTFSTNESYSNEYTITAKYGAYIYVLACFGFRQRKDYKCCSTRMRKNTDIYMGNQRGYAALPRRKH
jgi:hypothetical protein